MTLLLVSLFGALGCVLRFALEYLVRLRHPTVRPWGTVAANVLGSFIAGWAAYRFGATTSPHARALIITGLCGGITTFSSALAVPALLTREHHWKYAATLVVTTPLVCAVAFAVGAALH